MTNIITFDKSALPFLCEVLKVPYDPNIIAFTKEGAVTNILDLMERNEKASSVQSCKV